MYTWYILYIRVDETKYLLRNTLLLYIYINNIYRVCTSTKCRNLQLVILVCTAAV